jgi:amino acid transporter
MWGPIEATAGPVVPLVFLAALAIVLPTVLSYASLNRHAPSAGATATWLWIAVSPAAGVIAGLVMATYFVMTAITVPLLFSLFFRDFLDRAHIPVPGMVALAAGVVLHSAVIAAICVRGAEVSVKTTIRLMLVETAVVLALSATILWVKAGQPGGINLGPFLPSHATQGLPGSRRPSPVSRRSISAAFRAPRESCSPWRARVCCPRPLHGWRVKSACRERRCSLLS